MNQKTFTLQMIYKKGISLLEQEGIENASLDAWYLLEYVTGISRAAYYGEPCREIKEEIAKQYFGCIEKRKKHIPLQHITGEQEFMGYPFLVNEHVLIPRQDTESLVEEALKVVQAGMKVLDMCTGSGCILISLLKKQKRLEGTGCDVSEKALKIARENADRLGVEAEFIKTDLFEQVRGKYNLIISNPPYIRTEVIKGLQEEVRLYDPFIALDGKEDGLYFYRKIIAESTKYLIRGGYLMFEIGYDQGMDVSALMKKAGFEEIQVKKDLAGLDRVVTGRYNK